MKMRNILLLIALLPLLCSCGRVHHTNVAYPLFAPEDVVMYQVNPRVFAPSSSFNAVGEYLDSICGLGVNVVWFMPINEVGRENSVNSPYCVKDYKSVNPEFGTLDEFKGLVDACHKKGLHVIIDWVANHTSWDNAWIHNKEWYTWDEGGNIISPANTGWKDVADLNFDNKDMRLAMIDAMKFWVDSVGVDGFRCDAADFVPFDFWKQAIDSLRAIPHHPLLLLAEGKRKDHFAAGFDMNYAWDFLEGIRNVFVKDSCVTTLLDIAHAEYDTIPVGKVKLRFITNHDEMVKMSPVKEFGGERGAMAAFVLSSYLQGGALIYSSQEVAFPGCVDFFHYCHVDWNAKNEIRKEYEILMRLYNDYPAIRKGHLEVYPDCNIAAFQKELAQERFLVAVNVRSAARTFLLPKEWAGHECIDACKDTSDVLTDTLCLAPYEYRILKY